MSRYNEHGLTARQEKFALAYVRTMCAAEAYREAYSTKTKRENTIHCEASKLLVHPKVAQRVARLQSEAAERNEITVDKIVAELAVIAFAELDEGSLISASDKRLALVDLGKHLGMFRERRENANVQYIISDKPMTSDEWISKYCVDPPARTSNGIN